MRLTLFALSLLSFALLAAGCGDDSGNINGDPCTQSGFRCSTPDCADFPDTPGCIDVAPVLGFCPLSYSHCFDPTASTAYCEPSAHRCGSPVDGGPLDCPAECSEAATSQCWTIPDDTEVVCHGGQSCVAIACDDGGVADMTATPGD